MGEKCVPEKLFLYVAVLAGTLIALLVPPMQHPDENHHFWLSYNFSRGNFAHDVNGEVGVYSTVEVWSFIQHYSGERRADRTFSFWEAYFLGYLPVTETHQEFIPIHPWIEVNPLPHMIAAIGILIGRTVFTLFGYADYYTPYNMLLVGRLSNLIFYISVIYFAIKTNLYFKKTIMMLALMPMSIFLGASMNVDSIFIAVSFLSFSVFLKFFTDVELVLDKRELIHTAIIVFVFATIKSPQMIPMLFLLFAIPMAKFSSKVFWWKAVITCTTILGVGLLIANLSGILFNDTAANFSPYASELQRLQREFITNNPFHLLVVIGNTFSNSYRFWFQSFFGTLGNLDLNFPLPILFVFYAIFSYVFLYECLTSCNIHVKVRLFTLISQIVIIVGMVYGKYISWTPLVTGEIGGDQSTGIQGRYFIPMFMFSLFILMSAFLKEFYFYKKLESISVNITTMGAMFFPITTVLYILMMYYMY